MNAVAFVARGTSARLLDLSEVALRKAVEQHRALKAGLHAAGVAVVPLLLVQAASDGWTPERAKKFLLEQCGFAAGSVAVHTAAEPDPDVQALAHDPNVEVLVFKMAVATGFDAPRAAVLCALRPVESPAFGLQVIGRVMRVHPLLQARRDLPPALDTAYVFLGEAEGQAGLRTAADRMRAVRSAVEVVTDDFAVYMAGVDGEGRIALLDEAGQSTLELTPPPAPPPAFTQPESGAPAFAAPEPVPLFAQLAAAVQPAAQPLAMGNAGRMAPPAARPRYEYPMRRDVIAPPRALRTERLPRDVTALTDALVRRVRFTADHLNLVRQRRADIERQEVSLFDDAAQRRSQEQAEISFTLANTNARRALEVSDSIDARELAIRLKDALRRSIAEAGQDVPDEHTLRRALHVILVREPNLCRNALREAMSACMDVVDAEPLPASLGSDEPLEPSPLNLYGCRPRMNTWEQSFADWLDRQDGVLWWLRNPAYPSRDHRWGVRIMLPNGPGYYPDLVVCVDGRKKAGGIALAETKERVETGDSEVKARTDHREYGAALMLRYDAAADRFMRVEFDRGVNRNRDVAWLRFDDLEQA